MERLSNSRTQARERRERYYDLRRQGASMLDAAAEVGMYDSTGAKRYEKWFQAIESQQVIIPGRFGRKPSRAPQA